MIEHMKMGVLENQTQGKKRWIPAWIGLIVLAVAFVGYMVGESRMLGNVTNQQLPTAGHYQPMRADSQYQAEFQCNVDKIRGIELFLQKVSDGNTGSVSIRLYHEEEMVQEWKIKKKDVADTETTYFPLDQVLEGCKGDILSIEVSCEKDAGIKLGTTTRENVEQPSYRIIYRVFPKSLAFAGVCGFAVAGMIAFIHYRRKIETVKKIQVEKIFLFLYIMISLFSFLAIPIFNTPDEVNHFYRIYEISKGHLISDTKEVQKDGEEYTVVGREFPEGLCPGALTTRDVSLWDIRHHWNDRLNESEKVFYEFPNTALYAPHSYIPQAVGVAVADIFTDFPVIMAYAGRVMNCAVIGLLTVLAIRLAPFGKNLIAMIALLPMSLQAANSLSADGLALAVVLLFTSYILFLRYKKKGVIGKKEIAVLYTLIVFLCCCKIVYVPFCLLLFAIPIERFKSRKSFFLHVVIAGCAIVILTFGWLAIASSFLGGIKADVNVDTAEQLKYILIHPLRFCATFFRTLEIAWMDYFMQMLGDQMGWLTIQIPPFIVFPFAFILAADVFLDNDTEGYSFKRPIRALMVGTSVFIFFLIFVTLYGQWTPVGQRWIEGIQGRYFIPLLYPLLLGIKPQRQAARNGGYVPWNSYGVICMIDLTVFCAMLIHALGNFI